MKLILILRSKADEASIATSLKQWLGPEDMFISGERIGWLGRWKLTYQLCQLTPEHIGWLMDQLALGDLLEGVIETPHVHGVNRSIVIDFFGEVEPFRIRFHV